MSEGTPAAGPLPVFEETLGQMFVRERALRGVSLEDVARETRIAISHLRAIEADRLGEIPDGVFLRGFLRNYAEYLGLDANQVLTHAREQQQRLTTRTLVGRDAVAEESMLRTMTGGWGGRRRALLLAAAGLLAATAIALAVSRLGRASAPAPTVASAPSAPALAPQPVPSAPPGSASAAAPVEMLIMVGADDRRAFVRLTVDGELKHQGELGRADQLRFSGRRFELYTPSAGSVQIRVDGKLLPPLGRRGETLHHWEYRAGAGVTPESPAARP